MSLVYQNNIPLTIDSNDSYWYAVHNPIILEFQRKDFEVGAIADDGSGNAKVTLVTPDAVKMALVEEGQSIYIDAFGGFEYKGIFTVLDTDSSTYITIDTPFIGNVTDAESFLNANDALVGYYVDVKINREDGTLLQLARWVPIFDGSVTTDISGYVRRLAAIEDTHDYDPATVIERDLHLSTAITFFQRERFNGEGTAPAYNQIPTGEEIYWVNAAKQLGDLYGSNMAEYVPFPQTTGWNAKFLTLFNELIFFRGYPLEVALIISAEVIAEYTTHMVYLVQREPLVPVPIGEPAEWELPVTPTPAGVYRINIDEAHLSAGTFVTISLVTDGTPQDDQLTEEKKIHIRDCALNSIYLKWINTLGGWSYWMFEFDQQKSLAVSEAKTFQQTIYDLATADSALQYLSKRAFPKMTIGADGVSAENIAGLKGILYSPKVMWLTNPDTWDDVYDPGAKWQTAMVDPGSFNLETTRAGYANIELVVEFPEISIQTQ